MAWKGRGLPDIEFSQLLNALNNSRLQQSNNALYQTIFQIITKLQTQKDHLTILFKELADKITTIGDTIITNIQNLKDATFWTRNDETLDFPSSIRVIAGPGIILDYTVLNQVTVSSSGSGGVLPMVNGDEPPQLMSNGAGDLIVIAYDMDTP